MLSMDRARTPPAKGQWFWSAGMWSGIALFGATQTVVVMHAEGMQHAWFALFWTSFLSWMPWAVATPFVLQLGRRYPLTRLRPVLRWVRHLAACIAVALVAAAWNAGLDVLFNPYAKVPGPGPFSVAFFSKFWNGLLSSLLLYAFILVVSSVLDSRERLAMQKTERARLNEQLSKAQLNELRRQIEPHFLFNTLNAIAGLVREQKTDAAVSTIASLSALLSRAVEDSNRLKVPLGEEMECLEKYLEIQKVRFAERLQLNIEVPTELLAARVPSLILQPIVENAVKHGIARRAQGGEIQ